MWKNTEETRILRATPAESYFVNKSIKCDFAKVILLLLQMGEDDDDNDATTTTITIKEEADCFPHHSMERRRTLEQA